MGALQNAKQEVVLVSVVALSLVVVVIFQTVGGCFFQACTEWASFRTPHLITTWLFFAWCIIAGYSIRLAQNANWGLYTIVRVGRYRMSRLRALVFSLLLILHVAVIAYWWDVAWQRRVDTALEAARKPAGGGGHAHRRQHGGHGGHEITRDMIKIPITWQIVCSQLFRVMGHPPAIQLALTLLPVSRNSVLGTFLKMDYDDTLEFHRWSGIWTLAFTLAHGLGHELPSAVANNSFEWYAKRFFNINKANIEQYRSWLLQTGYWSTLLFIHIIFHALPFFRRRNYTWFYINHFLAWGAIILSIIHASPMLYLALPSFFLYILDAAIRLRRRAKPSVVKSVTVEPCGYIRMDIEGFSQVCQPAQWVNVRIPGLGRVMYHPFTVAGIHRGVGAGSDGVRVEVVGGKALQVNTVHTPTPADSISLLIKPSGKVTRFTNNIVSHFQTLREKDTENSTPMVLHVDGPFGSFPDAFFNADTFIVVAGGSGISGALGIASAILDAGRLQKVYLLWTSREVGIEETSLYKDLLSHSNSDDLIAQTVTTGGSNPSPRVAMPSYFSTISADCKPGTAVSIYGCGPESLARDIQVEAEKLLKAGYKVECYNRGYER